MKNIAAVTAPFILVNSLAGLGGGLLAGRPFPAAGLPVIAAAVLGGFGSIPGAVAGGIVIGIVESMSGFYLPEGFKDVAAYIVVLAVLLWRPQGMFGSNAIKKV